ncbi:MAG: tRNA (guanosine(46)-N7)-methyltransferase TrmB [Clostridiales bacterium]|nr:tRNA (guanosine(46)-N7)-methyltransferase TrmB [Candidatus Crickella caballi]
MRQRKIKNLETKLEAYNDLIVWEPLSMKGKWDELAKGKPIYLEIGCGKGKFISELAAREPENFFVAVEGNQSVLLRALEKVRKGGLTNVCFAPIFVEDLTDWFEDEEVTGIYLNFSDPLPKNYWYRRRLTYRERLKTYFRVLKDEGTVTFKTDNTGLFEWSIQEILAANIRILEITRDLHADEDLDNIKTEYEAKFSGLGETIKRVKLGRMSPREHDEEGRLVAEKTYETEGEKEMAITSMAAYNGRDIPKEDKVFAASGRAKAMIAEKGKDAVINATIGSLLDDEGKLVVMSSVEKTIKTLSGSEYAEYAPIAGTPGFKEAIMKAAFNTYDIKSYTAVVATPGGTGAIRNTIANYSQPGDKVLTHNWHWAPYTSIAAEMGRSLEHFDMFDEDGKFNLADFEYKVGKLLKNQEHLVIIINTPANNPTGYSLSMDDWYGVKKVLDAVDLSKKVALLIDVAYIDFAGEDMETREFLKVVDNLRGNILPIIAYSASKTFSLYGFRCAAMICMAHNPEVAAEFERVCTFSSRASWSNSPRAPQTVIEKIYSDAELLEEARAERRSDREMLLARGRAFDTAAAEVGLSIVPFRAGFFVTIPCEDPDKLCAALEQKGVFLVPISGGVRVSVASIPEKDCAKLPAIIKETIDEVGLK